MTVSKRSAWLSEEPRQLLDRTIQRYGQLLRAAEEVGLEHLEKADYAFRHKVVRLLVRAAKEDELASASDALRGVLPIHLEETYPQWSARWLGFSDLLEARLAALRSRTPGVARSLNHAERILKFVEANPGLNQAAIGANLELGAANLSRILGVLEAHELIERREVGREKHVYVGRLFEPSGEAAMLSEVPPASADAMQDFEYGFAHLLVPKTEGVPGEGSLPYVTD